MKKIHRGDDGYTDVAGDRVPKDSPIVEFLGSLDELISFLGVVRSVLAKDHALGSISSSIKRIQIVLMAMASAIAKKLYKDFSQYVIDIENEIAALVKKIPLEYCIAVPGSSYESAILHLARTLCRYVERRAVVLLRNGVFDRQSYIFLNRLSDLLYLYAIYTDFVRGINIECFSLEN